MNDGHVVANPDRLARTIGLLILALLVLGPFSMLYVPGQIVVDGDATGTAENLRASGGLLRAGIVADAGVMLIEIAVPVLLYLLLRPVNRAVALVAALSRFAEAVVIGVSLLAYVLALRLADSPAYLEAFDSGQRDALALLALDSHADAVYIGQLFFAFSLFLLGWLVYRAGYLPQVLGVLLWVAAAGYAADGFGNLLWSGYEDSFGWLVGLTALVGEVPFFLWLLIKGVDRRAWNDRVLHGAHPQTEAAAEPEMAGR